VRQAVVQAIGQIELELSKQGKLEKSSLETMLKDPDWAVRQAAVQAIGQIELELFKQGKLEKSSLETMLKDPGWAVRQAAAQAIVPIYIELSKQGKLEKSSLETMLKDPNWAVRQAAVQAIGQIELELSKQGKLEKSSLETMLKEPDSTVRQAAVQAIVPIYIELSKQGKLASLETMLKDPDSTVRQAVVQAIGQIELELSKQGRILDEDYEKYKLWVESDLPYEERLIEMYLTAPVAQAFISNLRQAVRTSITLYSSVKFAIRIYEVASINAAKGLIKALGLDTDRVVILYDKEIDSGTAEKFFPGYEIRAFSRFSEEGVIRVEFHDYGTMVIDASQSPIRASLPYVPFKFNLPERGPETELSSMRESLGIGQRKVIVIGSPSDAEFNEFIQAYNSLYGHLPCNRRPLLIIGFRQRRNENELRLLGSLSGQSIAVRSDADAALPDVAANNVLILNTAGELLKMYALADVAIVGRDRNIFEPASQKVAVLYFDGSWQNNQDAKEALAETGAAREFTGENLERFINLPGDADEMAERGLRAVGAYRKTVASQAERFALSVILADYRFRDKLMAVLESSIIGPTGPDEGRTVGAASVWEMQVLQLEKEAQALIAEGKISEAMLLLQAALDNAQRLRSTISIPDASVIADKIARLSISVANLQEAAARATQSSTSQTGKPLGGIDLRSLPIVTQAIGNLRVDLSAAALQKLGRVNPDEELQQIQRIAGSGIRPSTDRIKEYLQAACVQGNCDRSKIILCISGILRQEEEQCSATDPALRDILVVLESGQDLKEVFLGT
jgi:hypothetical protein